MAINPAKTGQALNNPQDRANELNDPQFENSQGYFPYDLTHQEFITPRFGEVTPSLHLDTAPADRTVVHDNFKTVLTQINGNFLNKVNQYVDSFYVPLRSVFPNNYEKLIPNPTKGDDLPNSALPQFPLRAFIREYLHSSVHYSFNGTEKTMEQVMSLDSGNSSSVNAFAFARMLLLSTVFSRGQLLDYLGCAFDIPTVGLVSDFQKAIDDFQNQFYVYVTSSQTTYAVNVYNINLDLTANAIDLVDFSNQVPRTFTTKSEYRDILSDAFEAGKLPFFYGSEDSPLEFTFQGTESLPVAYKRLLYCFDVLFPALNFVDYITTINNSSNPFKSDFINIGKPLAYQQCIAQYFTRDSIDNIFNSDLFMQLLRATMFPAGDDGFSSEPTFTYNGVTTEYDYISCGATYYSLVSNRQAGHFNRQYVWMTLLLLMRRSLRYGDYFSTARPFELAVGQLHINVTDGKVSPVDVTKNLLMQRYLNAANYIGSGFLQFYASMYGVVPSDTGTFPRYVAHRTVELANDITTNTADNQGAQTTNLIGYSDNNAFDVFIDDYGFLISVTSYDVLPVYVSGIENTYHFSDRFDYFNPMLQGIGDQPILLSELHGYPEYKKTQFGYTMRNAEYKFKLSKAHGAFVNSLPGFLLKYPLFRYTDDLDNIYINPDFIRDKPSVFDAILSENTAVSPGEYYHFVVSVTNQVQCARKIQATPPVLF